MYPRPNQVFTTEQAFKLDLTDVPFLRFYCAEYDTTAVVQTSHVTDEQLLAVPGFADLKWTYQYTTREDIPLFLAVDASEVLKCVDVAPPASGSYSEEPWVTPKGRPREQYVFDPNAPLSDWEMSDGQGA